MELNNKIKSIKPILESKKFARFFIQMRIVRLWFKLSNYKNTRPNFENFEKESND